MIVVNYTDARAGLKKLMDRVNDDCAPAMITRQKGQPVVMVSLAEWNSMEETNYLMSSPENARRLGEAIDELNAGGGTERELITE